MAANVFYSNAPTANCSTGCGCSTGTVPYTVQAMYYTAPSALILQYSIGEYDFTLIDHSLNALVYTVRLLILDQLISYGLFVNTECQRNNLQYLISPYFSTVYSLKRSEQVKCTALILFFV